VRLPERADEVLALGQVHARLATDRLRRPSEQRRRDVHDRHTAVPHRGGEPGDVGDHPTPTPITTSLGSAPSREAAAQLLDRRERLVLLAVPISNRSHGTPGSTSSGMPPA
jgi:hypothetical protein